MPLIPTKQLGIRKSPDYQGEEAIRFAMSGSAIISSQNRSTSSEVSVEVTWLARSVAGSLCHTETSTPTARSIATIASSASTSKRWWQPGQRIKQTDGPSIEQTRSTASEMGTSTTAQRGHVLFTNVILRGPLCD